VIIAPALTLRPALILLRAIHVLDRVWFTVLAIMLVHVNHRAGTLWAWRAVSAFPRALGRRRAGGASGGEDNDAPAAASGAYPALPKQLASVAVRLAPGRTFDLDPSR